MKQAEEN